ncbi:hypothetical protein DES34_1287 [Brevibacillus brevis]|nr:hypothetical protein C7J99_24880 [Brevibacillus brevis]RED20907.1 hypothetical protein DES34_1287 [Brevibacillus brevis]GEC93827.1 hypothetical protein BBR01nite_61580 [Brevibacillus brevis]VEF86618.1 Uncharacterised protein [Brevibacillus brevis]
MTEFLQHLNSIVDINELEMLREGLVSRTPSADLTWHDRNLIYEQVQAIILRIMQLELQLH